MLQTHFETLTDVRQRHKIKHDLLEIVMLTVCAVVAGIDSWWQIADFVDKQQDFFRSKFGFRNRVKITCDKLKNNV